MIWGSGWSVALMSMRGVEGLLLAYALPRLRGSGVTQARPRVLDTAHCVCVCVRSRVNWGWVLQCCPTLPWL